MEIWDPDNPFLTLQTVIRTAFEDSKMILVYGPQVDFHFMAQPDAISWVRVKFRNVWIHRSADGASFEIYSNCHLNQMIFSLAPMVKLSKRTMKHYFKVWRRSVWPLQVWMFFLDSNYGFNDNLRDPQLDDNVWIVNCELWIVTPNWMIMCELFQFNLNPPRTKEGSLGTC